MRRNLVILIDNDFNHLAALENAIKRIDPDMECISFIFADEALRVLSDEPRFIPKFIVMDTDLQRKSLGECLAEIRRRKILDDSKIIVFSLLMPQTVANTFKAMGADYAFQKPLSNEGYRTLLADVMATEAKFERGR